MSSDDMVGQRFGRLAVLHRHPDRTAAGKMRWVCRCDCGNETVGVAGNLRSGKKVSCGCAHREHLATGAASRTHGLSRSPEYSHWKAMKKRCDNPNDVSYHRYGGRGITVCARWSHSFPNFLADMGARPSPAHSIERRDGDLGYSPDNCHWATPLEQARNTSRNRRFTYQGETKPLSEWCEVLGLSYPGVLARIDRSGLTFEEAVSTPIGFRPALTCCRWGHAYNEANTYVNGSKKHCRTCKRISAARILGRKPHRLPATHCRRGHPFDEANTYVYKDIRSCRTCAAITRKNRTHVSE